MDSRVRFSPTKSATKQIRPPPRLTTAGGSLSGGISFTRLEQVDPAFGLIVNCAGIGARELVPDPAMEPHRGQVAIVRKFDLSYAVVCDDPPLMYAIPRSKDC